MIQVGIIGGAGYTAGELIRLLINHPETEINFVYSTSNAGNKISSVHQDLLGDLELKFTDTVNPNVDVVQAHVFFLLTDPNLQSAADADGQPVLCDLVAFRQIGVEIVFPVEAVAQVDFAAQRQAQPDGKFHLPLVEPGQRTGVAQ